MSRESGLNYKTEEDESSSEPFGPSDFFDLAAPRFDLMTAKLERLNSMKHIMVESVRTTYRLSIDDNVLSIVLDFLECKWVWKSLFDAHEISESALHVVNRKPGDSCWNQWLYTDPFPEEGCHSLRIRINEKRRDNGWIGMGIIRKSFVRSAKISDGGFKVYSKHAIFVDPSWDAHEPHFNLIKLNVEIQASMGQGDELVIQVDNDEKRILFFRNHDAEPFAEGNWKHLHFEPVCGYAILTSNNDSISIVP